MPLYSTLEYFETVQQWPQETNHGFRDGTELHRMLSSVGLSEGFEVGDDVLLPVAGKAMSRYRADIDDFSGRIAPQGKKEIYDLSRSMGCEVDGDKYLTDIDEAQLEALVDTTGKILVVSPGGYVNAIYKRVKVQRDIAMLTSGNIDPSRFVFVNFASDRAIDKGPDLTDRLVEVVSGMHNPALYNQARADQLAPKKRDEFFFDYLSLIDHGYIRDDSALNVVAYDDFGGISGAQVRMLSPEGHIAHAIGHPEGDISVSFLESAVRRLLTEARVVEPSEIGVLLTVSSPHYDHHLLAAAIGAKDVAPNIQTLGFFSDRVGLRSPALILNEIATKARLLTGQYKFVTEGL